MAENNSKHHDKAKNMPDMEQPVTVPETEAQLETSTAAPRKKRRVGPWLFLLLIFVGLPAAWLLAPAEFRQQAKYVVDQITSRSGLIQHSTNASSANESMTPGTQVVASAPEQAVETSTEVAQSEADVGTVQSNASPLSDEGESNPTSKAVPPAPKAVDSAAPLQEEINRLQGKLSDMQTEREQLTQQLKTSRVIELRVWLSLLASADTRLSQRVEMWSYLASLPSLDESEQKQAREMARTLQLNVVQLADLRKGLKQLGESIPEEIQTDIIPKPENPYLAWLLSAFHLRPTPGAYEMQKIDLKKQLLNIEHALSIEDWPEESTWRQLLKAVREKLSDSDNLDLSKSMDDIRGGIDISRKAASDWMEAL